METKLDVDAFVLCAGKQSRFGMAESKMMFDVDGKPAFAHLMQTLLSVLPQHRIVIVSSGNFGHFDDFVSNAYPQARLIFDQKAGMGTLTSFRTAMQFWATDTVIVTAGDIFFEPTLVHGLLHSLEMSVEAKISLAVTPYTDAAPTHSPVSLDPFVLLPSDPPRQTPSVHHRNVGAYAVRSTAKKDMKVRESSMITVFRRMQEKRSGSVVPYVYNGTYLHTAIPADVEMWRTALTQPPTRLSA